MKPLSPRLCVVLAAIGGCMTFAACGAQPRPATTSTTSGSSPRPDATAVTTRTIDNAGFVDNAGRTNDETNRTSMSGMRATETGSERPTGTPGSGLPVPLEPRVERPSGERAGAPPSAARPGAIAEAPITRIARARCDVEFSCGRIGHGERYPGVVDCLMQERTRTSNELLGVDCPRGIDAGQLTSCLASLRAQSCTTKPLGLSALAECQPGVLCVRP